VKVSADGHGVVSHAGVGILREVAGLTGLSAQVTAALAGTYRGPWTYAPGAVFADLAAAVAGGADCIDGVGSAAVTVNMSSVLRRRRPRCGASSMRGLTPSICPVSGLPALMPGKRPGRPGRHRRPGNGCTWISMPPSRSITPTTKSRRARPGRRRGVTTGCWRFWTAPRSLAAKRWPRLLRPGNAGSNTAADHVQVLQWALESLPAAYRPTPDDRGGPQVLVRCDSAGATHTFADACRAVGVGTRLILRKERLHPRAQLRFTDSDGLRVTAFITDTPTGVVPRQLAGLELRHRQHARVEEDRIREAKATGLRNLPCHRAEANAAWLEIILAATDLVAWTKLIGFT
jgi:Transposase DDE domain group 1